MKSGTYTQALCLALVALMLRPILAQGVSTTTLNVTALPRRDLVVSGFRLSTTAYLDLQANNFLDDAGKSLGLHVREDWSGVCEIQKK